MSEFNFIFDLDGTLYDLDGVPGTRFGESSFCRDMIASTKAVISDVLEVDEDRADAIFEYVMKTYSGELSIGLEAEYGIDRYSLFEQTWNKDPGLYIPANSELANQLQPFAGRSALLSAAPRVWVDRVLSFLELEDIFEGKIYTGEPDLRKPNPQIFALIAKELEIEPINCISIGDQNHSDILPAKEIGMQTALIGDQRLNADFFGPSLLDIIDQFKQRKII